MLLAQPQILLASQSPRRAALLAQIGVRFRQCTVNIDEAPLDFESATDYVSRLSLEKALAGEQMQLCSGENYLPVLGSDTCVVIDDELLGKPRDRAHAIAMLQQLSGRRHQVLTSVSLVRGAEHQSVLSVTDVQFKALAPAEIERYVDSGEPDDKAGAYAIQGFAAVFITDISGSYSGVMGLPLAECYQLLQSMDVL